MNKTKEISKKAFASLSIFSLVLASNIQSVFAYKVTDNFIKLFNSIHTDLLKFSTAAAAVTIVICALTILFSKNDRATQMSWDWGKRIVIAYFVILCSKPLINFIAEFKIK